jgi:hypothetical protein
MNKSSEMKLLEGQFPNMVIGSTDENRPCIGGIISLLLSSMYVQFISNNEQHHERCIGQMDG